METKTNLSVSISTMNKIIQRNGIEVESGFEDLVDALDRLRKIKRLGTGQVFVVDVSTTIKMINKRLNSKQNNRHRHKAKFPPV